MKTAETLSGIRGDKDKQPEDDTPKDDSTEEQNYTYEDLKEKFEDLMDIAVYQKKRELEARRAQEKLERETMMRKLSRGMKKQFTMSMDKQAEDQ